MTPEDIREADLDAFIDGELDEDARRAVEHYLAARPELAARVMADMAMAHELRLLAADAGPVAPQTEVLAQRLSQGLTERRRNHQWARAAAVLAIFAGGWLLGQFGLPDGEVRLTPTPDFVEEALMSHRTALLRAHMQSQPEVASYDAREIQAAADIALPKIPGSWKVTDAQVYPSDEGPSVGMAFLTPRGPISLFAFNTQEDVSTRPSIVHQDGGQVAYWRNGPMAYALITTSDRRDLAAEAARMAHAGTATGQPMAPA